MSWKTQLLDKVLGVAPGLDFETWEEQLRLQPGIHLRSMDRLTVDPAAESSDASNAVAVAMSLGWPMRPNGVRDSANF